MTICETTRRLRVEYSLPVRDCRRALHVFPPPVRGGQSTLALDWRCDPKPDFCEESEDDFGNRVLSLHHRQIEREFNFEMRLVTSHDASTPIARAVGLPASGVGAFLLPSALCDWTSEIAATAREFRARHASPHQLVEEICDCVYRAIEYSPGATFIETPASQSWHARRGVCQDFAHAMIALCRALRIPARYISGYLPGEGAAHAWCEVLLENQWHGFDPTHNRKSREDYVFVACGRDFRDVASSTGTYRGRATAKLDSWCKTTPRPSGSGLTSLAQPAP